MMTTLKDEVLEFEADLIVRALEECKGNVSQTAKLLGMTPRTLHRKMQRHGIDPDLARPPEKRTGGCIPPDPKAREG